MTSTWIKRTRTRSQRFVDFLIEEVPASVYVAVFALIVLGCGVLYAALTPRGSGMEGSTPAGSTISWGDGIYFSVVTVSSLGYGDIHPMGWSRALACMEVLFGLVFMGIMVAKVTSRRLSHHVKRLFSADAQRRLNEFASNLEQLELDLRAIMQQLSTAYLTPTIGPQATQVVAAKQQALIRLQTLLSQLALKSGALASYLAYEAEQGGYFEIAPEESVKRVVASQDKGLFNLSQLIVSLSPEARAEAFDRENRQTVTETLDHNLKVCDVIDRHARNTEVRNCSRGVRQVCERVRDAYFITPAPPAVAAQPDQVVQVSNQPQETTGQPLTGAPSTPPQS